MKLDELPPPAVYAPFVSGRYGVAPSLRPLGTPFGNGEADERVFQLDREFSIYRENKQTCREERLGKYASLLEPHSSAMAGAVEYLARQLAQEHPAHFLLSADGEGWRLDCRLTGETLLFSGDWRLQDAFPHGRYADAWDALACQIQEDLALVEVAPDGADQIVALHICAPSAWIPEEKLGLGFAAVHAPVPGIEPTARVAPRLNQALLAGGPFVRFVWGLAGCDRLNRHPEPPVGCGPDAWNVPAFRPEQEPPFWLRVERQVLVGLPEVGAYLFVIRLYRLRAEEAMSKLEWREGLRSALSGMSAESLRYKGLEQCAGALLAYLAPS